MIAPFDLTFGRFAFIGQVRRMVFFIQLLQLVGYLSFLETAVTDRGHDRVPFAEAVFTQHRRHVFRLHELFLIQPFGTAVGIKLILAANDILFFLVFLEPLVDLVFR